MWVIGIVMTENFFYIVIDIFNDVELDIIFVWVWQTVIFDVSRVSIVKVTSLHSLSFWFSSSHLAIFWCFVKWFKFVAVDISFFYLQLISNRKIWFTCIRILNLLILVYFQICSLFFCELFYFFHRTFNSLLFQPAINSFKLNRAFDVRLVFMAFTFAMYIFHLLFYMYLCDCLYI